MTTHRLGIMGLLHESNTFVSERTTRGNFEAASLETGDAIVDTWAQRTHEIGGFFAGCARRGFEPVPVLAGDAMPSGTIASNTFADLVGEMLHGVERAGHLDGILLAQHGAAVAEDFPDADGEVVSQLRRLVGPELPIVMTLDPHANVSQRMIQGTSATVAYRTVPHVDQKECGLEAVRLMEKILRGGARPVQALAMPPLLINVRNHNTAEEPAAGLIRDLEKVCERTNVLSASLCFGYAWADVAEMGTSFIVVADGDEVVARAGVDWLVQQAWERRGDYVWELPTLEQAVGTASSRPEQTVVLSDIGDNIGAGAPGDGTFLLQEILRQGVDNALVVLCDPEAVRQCQSAGVGNEITVRVGGKTDDRHGSPVTISGRVRGLADGKFFDARARHWGRNDYDQGLTAVVETGASHTIVLTSLRMCPFSIEQVRSLGIDPQDKKLITVKAVIAPRAAYEEVTDAFVLVDTPGASSANLNDFDFRHRRHPMFPFEIDAALS